MYTIVDHKAQVTHWFVKAPSATDPTADPGPIFNWVSIYKAYTMVPKESKYFLIRGSRLFEMLQNFSIASQYVIKCFRVAADDITGARAAYGNAFEKKYKWPRDTEENIGIFINLRTDAFKSMQELNKFAKNFEEMRKQLFQIKVHFVQHELLDLLDFRNRRISMAQLEQKAIEYEKLAAQKKVQAETAPKVAKQASEPAVTGGPSSTPVEHHKSSHVAVVLPYTNTTKESNAPRTYQQSAETNISDEMHHAVSPKNQTAAVISSPKVVNENIANYVSSDSSARYSHAPCGSSNARYRIFKNSGTVLLQSILFDHVLCQ